jgi:hypothetical protein
MKLRKRNALSKLTAVLLAAAMILTLMLTGCSDEEVGLFTSIMNEPDKLSYEYECSGQIELAFDLFPQEDEGLVFESATVYRLIEEIVNGAGFEIKVKANSNEENTVSQAEVLMTPVFMGSRFDKLSMGVWADIDLTDTVQFKEYIKFPKILSRGALWEIFKDRDYMTIDYDDFEEMKNLTGIDLNAFIDTEKLQDQTAMANKYTDALSGLLIKMAGLLKTETAFIKSVEKDAAGNAKYEVSITDKGLKELASAFAKIDKKEMKEIVRTLLTATSEYLNEYDPDGEMLGALIPGGTDSLDALLSQYDATFDLFYPMLIESLNEFLASARTIKVLGNDGVTFCVSVSKDGFITGFDGVFDIIIDHRGYEIASGYRFSETISKTRVKLTFQSSYANINKGIPVEMPKITNTNSISFTRYMEIMEEKMGPISPFFNLDPGMAIIGGFDYDSEDGQERPDMLGDISEEECIVCDDDFAFYDEE